MRPDLSQGEPRSGRYKKRSCLQARMGQRQVAVPWACAAPRLALSQLGHAASWLMTWLLGAFGKDSFLGSDLQDLAEGLAGEQHQL